MERRVRNAKVKGRSSNKSNSKERALYVTIFICTILLLLIGRLTYIMIYKSKEYKHMAQGQWNSQVTVEADRGDITDRNGAILATSIDVYRVDLDLEAIEIHMEDEGVTKDEIAEQLSEASGVPLNEVKQKLNTTSEDGTKITTSTLIKGIDKELADKIKALNIYGVVTSISPKRYYPNDNFLSHVLGSVNSDNTGLNGIELQYDYELKGIAGYKIAEVDGSLDELPFQTVKYTSPVDGKTVALTIDENIQLIAEKAAEKGYEDNKAKEVSIVVMNPNNGEILAMVNKPDFNPNTPYEDYESFDGDNDFDKLQNMFRNGAISDSFEPGSTFKNFTLAAALEEGVVSESDTFYCDGGVKFGSITIKCWNTSGHGTQTLAQILQNSCNVGFMEVGARLGNVSLKNYIDKLGFGQVTGVDLPGESEGIVKSVSDMSEMDLATIAFGQTNTVNSLQLLQAFNAIANGGDLIQPHIMKEISYKSSNGTKVIDDVFTPIVKESVISEGTTAIIRDYLERTINAGGEIGTFMGDKNRRVGGKTGTAQTVDTVNGGYSSDKYIASVLSLYPVDDPQVTIYIKVVEPSAGQYYGGPVTTPILKSLYTELFTYMDSQVYKEKYTEKVKVVVPELRGKSIDEAKKILEELNLNIIIDSTGSKVTNMEPYPGALVEEGSNISVNIVDDKIDSNKIIMPNLKGKTLEEATNILNSLNISFRSNGVGIVDGQDVVAGKLIEKGTKVTLSLKE
ncbi:stage V sporulation protein D [Clostridium sp. Sa3CUN1]|uniref:Stage V sporulation protein D n=1 Tax=Clostridium gallinarum TaxID=2762246 RepID=A0ABR8Q3L0_9CLOT|nr:stage V sporulation protein D [Clostridium gallinarum]MBD7915005.1 stage V sporulation protein D [Clostridium gallinarum]